MEPTVSKYTVVNNTYIYEPIPDAKEYTETEIGDIKQAEFYPQFKVKKWDNEVNFSARLVDNSLAAESVTAQAEQIIWTKGDTTAKIYDITASAEHPEGALEFEIELASKPTTNTVQFTIQTKGLTFFKQPPLTKEESSHVNEEGNCIYQREERVVNSYAVYHEEPPLNFAAGKVYKTGKVGHIYRPKVQDAKGNTVWADIDVDTAAGMMTVTIPQDFLDTAAYPVTHAAGLTFGYTTAGGSATDMENQMVGTYNASLAGTGTSMTIYSNPSNVGRTLKGKIYLQSTKGALANGETPVITPAGTGAAWRTGTFATGPILAATDYYLMAMADQGVGTHVCHYDAIGQTNHGAIDSGLTYPTFPATFTADITNSVTYSIYVTYTGTGVSLLSCLGAG